MPEVTVMTLRRGKQHAERVLASLRAKFPGVNLKLVPNPATGEPGHEGVHTLSMISDEQIGDVTVEKLRNHISLIPVDVGEAPAPAPAPVLTQEQDTTAAASDAPTQDTDTTSRAEV